MGAALGVAHVSHHWWYFLLRGLFALAFGVLVLLSPAASALTLTIFIAAFALVDGVVAIVMAFRLRPSFPHWWMLLIHGVISAVFGIAAFMIPAIALIYVVLSVVFWMLFAGVAQLMLARAHARMGGSSAWGIFGGVLSIVLAVVAIARPGLTIAAVIVLIAWFAVLIGIVQIVTAFRVRKLSPA